MHRQPRLLIAYSRGASLNLITINLLQNPARERLTATKGYKDVGLEDPEIQKAYCYVDTGMIAANVYLFAAAEGLAAWFHNCDKEGLAKALSLQSDQRILFAQSVGNPDRS